MKGKFMLFRKMLLIVAVLFFSVSVLHAKTCGPKDVEKAVKEIYKLYSEKGHSPETRKIVLEKNKNVFPKRCDGLYIFINLGVNNLAHISPKLDNKPLPKLRDKTPKEHGKPKDFFRAFFMNGKLKPMGSYVNYVWTGADGKSLVCKASYIMAAKDPKNPKRLYIIGAGYERNSYLKKEIVISFWRESAKNYPERIEDTGRISPY